MVYYSNLVLSRRASGLRFRIAISEFVFALLFFLLSTVIAESVSFTSYFTGIEYIAACRVLIPLPEGVHNFLQSVGCFRIMPIAL